MDDSQKSSNGSESNDNLSIDSTPSGETIDVKAEADKNNTGNKNNDSDKGKGKKGKGKANTSSKNQKENDKDADSEYLGRTPLEKLGYTFKLLDLHKKAGTNRTETIKVNPELLEAVLYVMKEDMKAKDKEEALELALIFTLQTLR